MGLNNVLLLGEDSLDTKRVYDCLREHREYERICYSVIENTTTHVDIKINIDLIVIVLSCVTQNSITLFTMLNHIKPTPTLLFTKTNGPELMKEALAAGVDSFVVNGLKTSRITDLVDLTLIRFTHETNTKTKIKLAENAPKERKIIDRAKGLLMTKRHMTEYTAYKTLREMSMNQNRRMIEIAENVLKMSNILA
ncbi:MAG: ANTAR domain-containing protein [Gammaproteobacteria bacterium]|nr:ANTAR domain-containing protein [Gammaproteobacteria bacterium]